MGWLTKILKGSTHKVREGQYHGRFEENEIVEETSHMEAASVVSSVRDVGSDFDIEELDLAIALSIAEQQEKELDKGKEVMENENQLEEDELIARALQESLNVESPPRSTPPQTPSPSSPRTPSPRSTRTPSPLSPRTPSPRSPQTPPPPRLPSQTPPPPRLPQTPTTRLPRYDYGSSFIPQLYHPSGHRICAGCNSEIGQGRYLSCMGSVWHPECFCCHSCSLPISDFEFSMSDNRPYHKTCYKDLHHPKCDVCKNFIPTNGAGLIEYRAHPFWHQKYCPSHENDGTPRCCSCERMEQLDARYLNLDDGRKLCLECLDSSIMDTHECQPLYLEIREFYEGLNMKVEQQIPLLLVERQALNEAMEGEKNGHHHMAETRGLCLSEEQTVSTISRRPLFHGYRIIDMFTEPYRLVRKCEVTAILILYGLPRLLTGSILAHEMMHAWLRLQGYPNLSPDVEEGICQVLAHMWLDSEIIAGSSTSSNATSASSSSTSVSSSSTSATPSTSGSSKKGKRSDFEKKLGEFFEHQIESDTSTAYGDGFREGNKAVEKYGLRRTLDHIRYTGRFPE